MWIHTDLIKIKKFHWQWAVVHVFLTCLSSTVAPLPVSKATLTGANTGCNFRTWNKQQTKTQWEDIQKRDHWKESHHKREGKYNPLNNSVWVITFLWCSFCLLSSFFSCLSELDRKAITPRSTFPVTETTWGTDLRPSLRWKTINTVWLNWRKAAILWIAACVSYHKK